VQSTNDASIRELLIPFALSEHSGDSEPIYHREEFSLQGGSTRADLAVLNGISHGYEIKSDRDTLLRLPQQVAAYSAVFERATLVVACRHLSAARVIIRPWWGIVRVECRPLSGIQLERIRQSRPNPAPHSEAIASLLWRPEALSLLCRLGLDSGVRSKAMPFLVARLAEKLDPERLAAYVRQAIRARGDWRFAARLRQCGDMSQQPANLSRYRRTPYANICR
jgi:hypothetical protein